MAYEPYCKLLKFNSMLCYLLCGSRWPICLQCGMCTVNLVLSLHALLFIFAPSSCRSTVTDYNLQRYLLWIHVLVEHEQFQTGFTTIVSVSSQNTTWNSKVSKDTSLSGGMCKIMQETCESITNAVLGLNISLTVSIASVKSCRKLINIHDSVKQTAFKCINKGEY